MDLTIAEITLPSGITLNATNYPGTGSAYKLALDILGAIYQAQEAKNASLGGFDLLSLTEARGPIETITRSDTGTSFLGQRISYQLSTELELVLAGVFPVLGNQ